MLPGTDVSYDILLGDGTVVNASAIIPGDRGRHISLLLYLYIYIFI